MAHCDNANHEDEASLDDDDDDNGEDNGGTVPAKAINVNIVGVVLSVVCCNPVLQTVAHLLVLLILIWDVEDILKYDLSTKTYIDHLVTVLAVVLDLKVP